MPTSNPQMLVKIGDEVIKRQPKSFLDLGFGFGKYGVIAREYGDVWKGKTYKKEDWNMKLDGVDIFEYYISEHHKYIYDNIYIQDIHEFVKQDFSYDMAIFLDVIEHIPRDKGFEILDNLKKKVNYSVIATPFDPGKTKGGQFGNKNEAHISKWNFNDFQKYGDVNILKCDLQTGLTDKMLILEIDNGKTNS